MSLDLGNYVKMLICWEIPRLCREGSKSLIDPGDLSGGFPTGLSRIPDSQSCITMSIGVGIGIGVEIGRRKASVILNPIAIPIPMPTPMILLKPL